jgi:hypothetical protein
MGDINTPWGPIFGGDELGRTVKPADVFRSVGQAAGDAWNALIQLLSADETALLALWRFAAALQAEISYLGTAGVQPSVSSLATAIGTAWNALLALRNALNRTAWWVWTYEVLPVRFTLNAKIDQLAAWTVRQLGQLRSELVAQILAVRLFAALLFHNEQQARIKDVLAARKYALDLTTQLHQRIEHEAASGYAAGKGNRAGPLAAIVADLHVRGLISAAVNTLLVRAISILVSTGDPALEAVVTRVIGAVIKKSGLGSDLGNYLYGLIIPGQGGPDPKDLPSVVSDVSHRLGAIEDWITGFMLDGGPEVRQAGREWKTLTSLTVDAALLAFVGQAVVAPEAWAREVADTVGVLANDTIGGIVDLLHKM